MLRNHPGNLQQCDNNLLYQHHISEVTSSDFFCGFYLRRDKENVGDRRKGEQQMICSNSLNNLEQEVQPESDHLCMIAVLQRLNFIIGFTLKQQSRGALHRPHCSFENPMAPSEIALMVEKVRTF